ncbi:MAG: nitronate monooxygenase [Bacillota bacterium]|jgi:enoyl-[acyl-carrier protein] reductase II|nr:nitronate monooxygenase [Eubacteriales bacterium]MDD4285804.1 nitronate monooxygenase [Eubacteriales bacterium]MDI9491391.1 nitronate monooxygenase [Bacillota bacterium]HPF18802.1 nitronate monooxygenase [Bacillota bacterium]
MLRSEISTLLGIRYPVFQGGMAWIANAKLAAAVSEAGGLGIISAMNTDSEWLRAEIRKTRALTDKPFGVNIMLMSPVAGEMARVVIEEGVPVVTTGAGNPAKYMEGWRSAGINVIPVVASVAFARLMERIGASAVIAEGGESGGHVGDLSTLVLVPQVCDAVDIPVVAAGGIADGRAMAACLMLGASGVQLGTRFLMAWECDIHENYRNKLVKASDTATIVTGRRSGHPIRALKSPMTRKYAEWEFDSSIDDAMLTAIRAGGLRKAVEEGSEAEGYFMAGQVAGMLKNRQSAAEIVHSIAREAEILFKGSSQWLE